MCFVFIYLTAFLDHIVAVFLEIVIMFSKVAILFYNFMKFLVSLYSYPKIAVTDPFGLAVVVDVKVVLCSCFGFHCPSDW